MLHGEPHDRVPSRVVGDLVDAMAITIVGAEFGDESIGGLPKIDHLGGSYDAPVGADVVLLGWLSPFAAQTLQEGNIDVEPVDVSQGARLVRDFVGFVSHEQF
jgi:hypothetical protein